MRETDVGQMRLDAGLEGYQDTHSILTKDIRTHTQSLGYQWDIRTHTQSLTAIDLKA
jgi:hypothetical protein